MAESVEASLTILLYVECPYCEDIVDLLETPGLNEEGQLIKKACPSDKHWSESHDDFQMDFKCECCEKEFEIDGIGW